MERLLQDLGRTAVPHRIITAEDLPGAAPADSPVVVPVDLGAGAVARSCDALKACRAYILLASQPGAEIEARLLQSCDEILRVGGSMADLVWRCERFIGITRESAGPPEPGLNMPLIGRAPAFLAALHDLRLLANSRATILIEGETGTGKELAARAAHYLSRFAEGPFVPVNCGALPEALLENEMFGHRTGAYSGSGAARDGMVEEARNGTLFLDEIDALAPRAQASLLRFLQDGEYRRLGGGQTRHAKCRVIAASNAGLADAVAAGRFREDLYFRLAVGVVTLPPLRERPGDAALLARRFLSEVSEELDRPLRFSIGMLHRIEATPWSGNVRELRAFVERQALLSEGPEIAVVRGAGRISDVEQMPFAAAKAEAVRRFERNYLRQMMQLSKGNISRAARLAGKERRTFTRLLERHGLARAEPTPAG
nr:response regulator of zinc sigma-54-dependent two-component system [uncultured bacterium]